MKRRAHDQSSGDAKRGVGADNANADDHTTLIIQLRSEAGEALGSSLEIPKDITPSQLHNLVISLLGNDEPLPYSFFLNEEEITETLQSLVTKQTASIETVLPIIYRPQALFRVNSVARCTSSLPGHTEAILHVSFSADGQHLASGGGDATVRLWDVNTETPKLTLKGHTNWVLAVAWSPCGHFLASAGMDGEVRVWDVARGTLVGKPMRGHKQPVTALAWEPLISRLRRAGDEVPPEAAAAAAGDIPSVKSGLPRRGIMADGTAAPAGGADDGEEDEEEAKGAGPNGEKIVNPLAKKERRAHRLPPSQSAALLVAGTQLRLASASKDGTVKVWDAARSTCLVSLSGHTAPIRALKWGGAGLLYSGGQDRSIKVWDVEGKKLHRQLDGHAHWVNTLATNTEYALRTGPFDYKGKLPTTRKEIRELCESKYDAVVQQAGGEILASGSDDFTVFLWNPATAAKAITRMTGHQQPVNFVAFSPDGARLASASFDKSVRIWAGTTGKFEATLRGHVQSVYQLAWSADSRLLVSSSKDSTIKLWHVAKKKMLEDLPGHADEVFAVDWSPDGERVASGGKDKFLKVWRG